jgi:hypothetical protein
MSLNQLQESLQKYDLSCRVLYKSIERIQQKISPLSKSDNDSLTLSEELTVFNSFLILQQLFNPYQTR